MGKYKRYIHRYFNVGVELGQLAVIAVFAAVLVGWLTQQWHGQSPGIVALAAGLATGQEIPDAVISAKTFLNQCLRSPAGIGAGHGPMMVTPPRNDPKDRPTIR